MNGIALMICIPAMFLIYNGLNEMSVISGGATSIKDDRSLISRGIRNQGKVKLAIGAFAIAGAAVLLKNEDEKEHLPSRKREIDDFNSSGAIITKSSTQKEDINDYRTSEYYDEIEKNMRNNFSLKALNDYKTKDFKIEVLRQKIINEKKSK